MTSYPARERRGSYNGTTSRPHRVQYVSSDIPKVYLSQLKGSRFNQNRQALDPIPVNGKITNWDQKSGYGFVTPEVDLSKIKSFSEKELVFLHKNDCAYDNPKVGDEVSFFLYSDAKGIGAHACVKKGNEKSRIDDSIQKVVPMAIPNKLLGPLIGKAGAYINELTTKYNVRLSIQDNRRDRGANDLQLVTVCGKEQDVKEACKAICDQMTKSNLNIMNSKMLFLVPSEQVGRFIGSRGVHIRKAVQHEKDVSLTISKNSIWFQNTEWQKVILFGPIAGVQNCLDNVVAQLCFLFTNIVDDYTSGRKRVVKNSNRRVRDDYQRNGKDFERGRRGPPKQQRSAKQQPKGRMNQDTKNENGAKEDKDTKEWDVVGDQAEESAVVPDSKTEQAEEDA